MDNNMTPELSMRLSQPSGETEQEIDLIELGYELIDKLKYIIISAVIGLLISGVYTFFIATPIYEAVAKLYVLNSGDSVVNLADLQLGNYLASDYTEVFKTWEVNEMVRTNLGLDYTYEELEEMVSISNPQDTRILYISVQSPDPNEAMTMANEYGKVVSDYVSQIMATERPNTLSSAILPDKPVSPKKTQNLIIGLLLGLVISVGVIVIRFVLDDTVKSADDIMKYTGLTVLAIVPMEGMKEKQNVKGKGGRA